MLEFIIAAMSLVALVCFFVLCGNVGTLVVQLKRTNEINIAILRKLESSRDQEHHLPQEQKNEGNDSE